MNPIKKTWMITAVLLAISSIYGFAAFMVGREAYAGTFIGEITGLEIEYVKSRGKEVCYLV